MFFSVEVKGAQRGQPPRDLRCAVAMIATNTASRYPHIEHHPFKRGRAPAGYLGAKDPRFLVFRSPGSSSTLIS
jgi:hypothetical protein